MTFATGVIPVSHHQFGVTNIDNYPMPPRGQRNGLVEPADGGVVVKTGIHTGRVYLSVELRTDAPVDVDDSWEEITEVSIDPPAPRSLGPTEAALLLGRAPEPRGLRIVALMSDLEAPFPDLDPPGGGPCRLRVHARGRDANYDGVDSEPREEYLLVAWPASMADVVIHKQMTHNW
jgi:hypothetical protein